MKGPGTLVVDAEFAFRVKVPVLVLAPSVTVPVTVAPIVTVKLTDDVAGTATVMLEGLKVAPPAGVILGVIVTFPLKVPLAATPTMKVPDVPVGTLAGDVKVSE